MRTINKTSRFKADVKRLLGGRYRPVLQDELLSLVERLARDVELESRFCDHALIAGVQLAQQQLANGQGIEHELIKTMLFEMLNEEGVDEATDLSLEDIYQQALPRFTSIYTNGSY